MFKSKTKNLLTGAVKVMLLFPGSKVTFCTFSICPPSFMATAGGLTQLDVSGGEPFSRRRMIRWVFLHTTPMELRELSEGLLSWISSISSVGPAAAEEGGPADELPCLNSIVPWFEFLSVPLDLPWVPPWSMSKWMLAASCWMRTETGIRHLRVSSTCSTAPECTEAAAGLNCSRVSWAKTFMLRVTLWAAKDGKENTSEEREKLLCFLITVRHWNQSCSEYTCRRSSLICPFAKTRGSPITVGQNGFIVELLHLQQ